MKIEQIITHPFPHADEAVAILILQMYGGRLYQGIESARIHFETQVANRPEKEWNNEGSVLVGIGNGWFDEHLAEGARIETDCAATLVAKHLRVRENPELTDLLDEVFFCDTHPGIKITQLSELMKAVNRGLKLAPALVLKWANVGYRAIIAKKMAVTPAFPSDFSVVKFFDAETGRKRYPHEGARARVRSLLQQSEKNQGRLTEISYVAKAMHETGTPFEDVKEWLRLAFGQLYDDNVAFFNDVEFCKANAKSVNATAFVTGVEKCAKIGLVHMDSTRANAALRYAGHTVAIVRNSKGQVQIFLEKKMFADDDLANFAAMIRWSEMTPAQRQVIGWNSLKVEGEIPEVGNWYLFKGMMLNGTTSHPDKAPTKITDEEFLAMAKVAFVPLYVEQWKQARGIMDVIEGDPHAERNELGLVLK